MDNRRSNCDAAVEDETGRSDHQHHFRDSEVHIPKMNNECGSEQTKGKPQHDGQEFHDQVESPPLESLELYLVFLPSIDYVPPHRGLGIV